MNTQYIADLKAKCNIAEVIQDYIPLKKKGRDYEACCPFHDEATPSFSVSVSKNIFHCFGCGKTGDSIDFVQSHTGKTFHDSIAVLAEKYRLPMPERNDTPAEKEARLLREEASAALETAQAYYRSQSAPGTEYLRGRGFTDAVIERFEIGYAPAGPQSFVNITDVVGEAVPTVTESAMLAAGLMNSTETDGKRRTYEVFTDRVMFPIRSASGKLVAFGGRLRTSGKVKNKYINSPETLIYRKSQTVYGLHLASKAISATGTVCVVEGYTDVMRLHERGAENTVAGCGTALTGDQFALLKRYAHTAVLILDGDASGQKAMSRAVLLALQAGLGVKVLTLTDGTDPDSWAARQASVAEAIHGQAQHWTDAYADIYAAMTEPVERAAFAQTVSQCLAVIKDELLRREYTARAEELFNHRFASAQPEPEKKVTGKKNSPAPGNAQGEKVTGEKTSIDIQEAIPDTEDDTDPIDFFREHGFIIHNGVYQHLKFVHGEATPTNLSNFVMRFIFHFDDGSNNTRRLVKLQRNTGEVSIFELQDEETALNKFKIVLRSKNCSWFGSPMQLEKIYHYCMDRCNSAAQISRIGWDAERKFYALSDCIIKDGTVHKVDDFGVINIGDESYYLPAWSKYADTSMYANERRSCYHSADINFAEYARLIYAAYGTKGAIGLLFLINCIFRDVLFSKTNFFPFLFIYGEPGSGKSSFINLLLRVWGDNDGGITCKSTIKSIARTASQRSNAMMFLKEYDNNISLDLENLLKSIYDGQGYSMAVKSNDDRTRNVVANSGIIIDGNALPTKSNALYDRNIILSFDDSKFSDASSEAYYKLKDLGEAGFAKVLVEILSHRATYEQRAGKCFDFSYRRMKGLDAELDGAKASGRVVYNGTDLALLPDRTLNHLAFMYAPMYALEKKINFPFDINEIADQLSSDAVAKMIMMESNSPAECFWNTLDFISNRDRYKCMDGRQWMRCPIDQIVYIKFSELFPVYTEYCELLNIPAVDTHTLLKHLTNPNYAPYIPSTQKGSHTSHKKAGFGRCYQFRCTQESDGTFKIGERDAGFVRTK